MKHVVIFDASKMRDSAERDSSGVTLVRDSTERDSSGVTGGVTGGVLIDGSDLTEVEDNDSGSVESESSMFIRTSVLGDPVVVHTGVKGMPSVVSLLRVLDS